MLGAALEMVCVALFINSFNYNIMKPPKVKQLPAGTKDLSKFPNFSKTGSVRGMRKLYYGNDALLVKMGNYIYNVSSEPSIYNNIP